VRIVRERTQGGSLTYTAVPERYDGVPPVRHFLLDHGPLSINQEREAVACYLLFGRWTGGALKLPQPLGPATATAIERAAEPVPVRPETVAYDPLVLAMGEGTMQVHTGPPGPASRGAHLWVLRSDEWSGSLRAPRGIAVACNYFAFRSDRDPASVRALLATALLFAEDLHAGSVTLPAQAGDDLADLRALCAVTRLGLTTTNNGPSGTTGA
jgi:hypothetical protein